MISCAELGGRSSPYFAKAEKYWNKADEDLPELKHLH
jgi:hypothetical protein